MTSKPRLTQNLWERFGFRDNPYDTRALSLSPESALSVAEAFVGRGEKSNEWRVLTNFLRNPGGGCAVVEGDVGVGKTTFVNFHRYLWENEAETKLLTPASEISVQRDWGVREFLLSVVGALAGRLALKMGQSAATKDELLTEVSALTGVLFMMDDFDDFGAMDYSGMRVSDLVSEHGTKLRMGYEYDFGDGWQHEVVLEKVTESEPGIKYPRCIDGDRACPPEDVGGVYGFADYIEAITNPNHSEYDDFLEWNGPFDPAEFDATRATRRMKKGLPAW